MVTGGRHDGSLTGGVERRSPAQVEERLDGLIAEIRTNFHGPAMAGGKSGPCDVLIVAHGHISRAFAARWVKRSVAGNPSLILETGGVGILRFAPFSLAVRRLCDGADLPCTATSITALMSLRSCLAVLSLFQRSRRQGDWCGCPLCLYS
jgi:broad specificity phosphatase PhoE